MASTARYVEKPVAERDPQKRRAGAAGAEVRWPVERRVSVRLDELTPEQRGLVLSLVAAAKAAKAGGDDAA